MWRQNTCVGASAGNALTAGATTLIGYRAGAQITTGTQNTGVGWEALNATAAGVQNNTAVGYSALANVTSNNNTAVGANSLITLASNGDCTAVGYLALTLGSAAQNTAVGSQACAAVSSGGRITAVGYLAANANQTGSDSTAVGSSSLLLATGASNTALGSSAGATITTGAGNVFLGANAGDSTAAAATNHCVIGGTGSARITDMWVGNGETNATPLGVVMHATGGNGLNIAGATYTIAGGIGTGSGIGGSLIFQTAAATGSSSTANTLVTQLTIDQKGNVVVGNAAIATTATDGFLYVDSCAGPPTGVPTTFTGRVPIAVDTTTVTGKFWAYIGGTWRGIALT
jgi:hypothetical protein